MSDPRMKYQCSKCRKTTQHITLDNTLICAVCETRNTRIESIPFSAVEYTSVRDVAIGV